MSFVEHRSDNLVYMTAPNIPAAHAFTTRFGGVSRGIYASLNLAVNSDDDPSCVRENYRRLHQAVGIGQDRFVFSRQVHKTEIRLVARGDLRAPFSPVPYEADGLITAEEEVPLIIFYGRLYSNPAARPCAPGRRRGPRRLAGNGPRYCGDGRPGDGRKARLQPAEHSGRHRAGHLTVLF
jgi:hypothetical protein